MSVTVIAQLLIDQMARKLFGLSFLWWVVDELSKRPE
jgi:hypothetical protein